MQVINHFENFHNYFFLFQRSFNSDRSNTQEGCQHTTDPDTHILAIAGLRSTTPKLEHLN
jgi:hypothetical protein